MSAREVMNNRIRGIRQTNIPSGYVMGRTLPGEGPAHLIDLKTLGQQLSASGAVASPTAVSAGGSLAALSDVTITSLAANQILQYNGTKWVNVAIPAQSLAGLTDVNTTGLLTGNFLKYNGTKWVPSTYTVSGASDVTLTALASNQTLVWNGSAWVNLNFKLSALADTNAAAPSNLDLLSWDTASGKWINRASSAIGSTLASDTDVTITSPAVGDLLRYNGTKWVNYAQRKWAQPAGTNFTSSTNATAAATKGNFFIPKKNIIIDMLEFYISGTSAQVYAALIANITGSGNAATLASVLANATATITLGSTAVQTLEFTFSPTTLVAGNTYALCLVLTSSTTTTVLPILGAVVATYANAPLDIGLMIKTWNTTGSNSQFASWANNTTTPSALAVTGVGSGLLGCSFRFYDA